MRFIYCRLITYQPATNHCIEYAELIPPCCLPDVKRLKNMDIFKLPPFQMPEHHHDPQRRNTTSTISLILLILCPFAFFPTLFVKTISLPLLLLSPSTSPATSHPSAADLPYCQPPPPTMSWFQKSFALPPVSRGSYLITSHVESALPELKTYKVGLLNLFIQHTSCALSLNENFDADVRKDMSDALDRIAPEDPRGDLYRHADEGLDDMPVSLFLLSYLTKGEDRLG